MSADPPVVSVAIRAFRRRWLADAIASVLEQTFTDLELVIYDDAGDLEDVAVGFNDPRIRYERATQHFDASGRFRAAVACCRGRYLALLDDDDRYEPTFLARLVEALDGDPQAGLAFCRTTWDVDGHRSSPLDARTPGRVEHAAVRMLTEGWAVSPSHLVVRRRALEDASRRLPIPDGVAPDVYLNLGVALAGWAHVLVDAPLVVCCWHPEQVSRSFPSGNEMAVATWRQLDLQDAALNALRDRRLARALLVRAIDRLAHGDRAGAADDLRDADRTAPSAWRTPRQLIAIALACGPLAPLAARAWLRWSPRGRRRRAPPQVIGDR